MDNNLQQYSNEPMRLEEVVEQRKILEPTFSPQDKVTLSSNGISEEQQQIHFQLFRKLLRVYNFHNESNFQGFSETFPKDIQDEKLVFLPDGGIIFKETGDRVLIKQIPASRIFVSETELLQELQIREQFKQKNISRQFAYGLNTNTKNLEIITEKLDLCCIIDSTEFVDECAIASIVQDVLFALEEIHSKNITVRFVKSDNIYLDRTGLITLAWENSRIMNETISRCSHIQVPYWKAPEELLERESSCKSDIWSVGILVAELKDAFPPFMNCAPIKVLFNIVTEDIVPSQPASGELIDFISCCCKKNPGERPDASELLRHPFITKYAHRGRKKLFDVHRETKEEGVATVY